MENLKTKQEIGIEQQIWFSLTQIVENFPQYTIPQHLAHVLRKKNELQEFYFWNNEKFLQKIESYYDELKTDLINDKNNEEEYA